MNTLSKQILAANLSDKSGYISVPITSINNSGNWNNLGPKKNKPYFFLEKPNDKSIRHCRIYKDGFLDYTIKGTKWFETISEWVIYHNSELSDIKFGFETNDRRFSSVYVFHIFVNMNDIVTTRVVETTNEFIKLEQKMKKLDLGFKNLAIVNNSTVTMVSTFMDII